MSRSRPCCTSKLILRRLLVGVLYSEANNVFLFVLSDNMPKVGSPLRPSSEPIESSSIKAHCLGPSGDSWAGWQDAALTMSRVPVTSGHCDGDEYMANTPIEQSS